MLHSYLNSFSNLHSNKLKGMTAPHKAIMLISVIDMIANKKSLLTKLNLQKNLKSVSCCLEKISPAEIQIHFM